MSFQCYEKYKNSGIEWLGEVPEHWDTSRSKLIYREVIDLSTTGIEDLLSVSEYYGVKKRIEVMEDGDHISRAESLEGYKKCKPNDLVINIMLAWKRGLGISNFDGIVSPAYCVFRFVDEGSINSMYFHYLLRTDLYTGYFKSRSTGIIDSRLRLYPDVFGAIEMIFPPKQEQDSIAAFLDRETAKIDTLIAEQQRLIELLKEKRQAMISRAVTKGLNPDVRMKDSGVEWLGKVPEHWDLKRLKYICNIFPSNIDKKSCDFESAVFLCNYTDVYYNDLITKEIAFMKATASEDQIAKFELKAGDVIVTKDSETADDIAIAAYVLKDLPGVVCGYHLSMIRPCHGNNGLYVKRLFDSHYLKSCVAVLANGLTRVGLSQSALDNLTIPVPPQSEQHAITAYLDLETAKLDGLSAQANQAITLLQERRAALISAAVTGKIDVRGAIKQEAS